MCLYYIIKQISYLFLIYIEFDNSISYFEISSKKQEDYENNKGINPEVWFKVQENEKGSYKGGDT